MKKYIVTYFILNENSVIDSVNTEILNFHGHVNTVQLLEDLNKRCHLNYKIALISVIPEKIGAEEIIKTSGKQKVEKKKDTIKVVEPTVKERSSNTSTKNIEFQIIGDLEADLQFLVGKKCTILEKIGGSATIFTVDGMFTIPLSNLTVFKEE